MTTAELYDEFKVMDYTQLMTVQRLLGTAIDKMTSDQAKDERIANTIANYFDYESYYRFTRGRSGTKMWPMRFIALALKSITGKSLEGIGDMLDGRDHATVRYHIVNVVNWINQGDKAAQHYYSDILLLLYQKGIDVTPMTKYVLEFNENELKRKETYTSRTNNLHRKVSRERSFSL